MARAVSVALLSLLPVVLLYRSLGPFTYAKNALLQLGGVMILAVAAGAASCCSWERMRSLCRSLLRDPLSVAVLIGLVAASISTLLSISPGASWRGFSDHRHGLIQALCLGICFFACRLAWSREDIPKGFAAALAGLGMTAGYAVAQMLGEDPLRWVDESIFCQRLRPTGAMGHTNTLAALIVLTFPFLAYSFLTTWAAPSRGRAIRLVSQCALGLTGLVLLLMTLSRAGWLAWAVVVLALMVLWPGPRRKRLIGCALLLGVGLLVGFGSCLLVPTLGGAVGERFGNLGESSSRREIWGAALRIFEESPWTGSGLDTFGMAFLRFRTPAYWRFEWGEIADQAHNEFLHTIATQGSLGGLAYLVLRIAIVWSLIRAWRRPDQRRLVATLAASLVGYDAVHLFGFATGPISLLHVSCLGWLARLSTNDEGNEGEQTEVPRRPDWLPLACVVVGSVILAMNFCVWGEGSWRTCLLVSAFVACGGALALLTKGKERGSPPGAFLEGKRAALGVAVLLGVLCGPGIIDPVLASWHAQRADSFLSTDPARVRDALTTAVRLDPREARIHAVRAKCLQELAQRPEMSARRGEILREAVEASEEACRLEPCSSIHHGNRGRILGDAARAGVATAEAAFGAFDRALELDPHDTQCLADAGRAAVGLGLADEGEAYVERGLEFDSDLAFLHAEQGGIALVRKQYDRAERILETALAKDWHGDVARRERSRCLLALAKLERGDALGALTQIEIALPFIPDFLPARWLHASTLERLGRRESALQVYRHILSRQPDHAAAAQAVHRLGGS